MNKNKKKNIPSSPPSLPSSPSLPSLPSLAIVITRWYNRTPHPLFQAQLASLSGLNIPSFLDYNRCSLHLATHGTAKQDAYTIQALCSGNFNHFHDPTTNNRFPLQTRAIFEHFTSLPLSSKPTAIVLIDDDACFTKPEQAILDIQTAIRTLPSSARLGAFGPIDGYHLFSKYANYMTPQRIYPLAKLPWTTFGCQVYTTEFLIQTRQLWFPLLSELEFRMDVPMFMLAHAHGFFTGEMHIPGWKHETSGARATAAPTYDWLQKRTLGVDHDYDVMLSHLPTQYHRNLERQRGIEKRRLLKIAKKYNLNPE